MIPMLLILNCANLKINDTFASFSLGKWYHPLKSALKKGVPAQGLLIHLAIQNKIEKNEFAMLLNHLDVKALNWKNPENYNKNALEVAMSISGLEGLQDILCLRTDEEYELKTRFGDKVGHRLRVLPPNASLKTRSKLLIHIRNANPPTHVFEKMIKKLGVDAYKHIGKCVCFDSGSANVKSMSSNKKTIRGTFEDNKRHGALLNVGINAEHEKATWSFTVDSNPDICFGLSSKSPCPSYSVSDSSIIGFYGGKKICDSYKSVVFRELRKGDIVSLSLIGGCLLMSLNGSTLQLLKTDMKGTWWPYFGMCDWANRQPSSITLKSFSFDEFL
eukprot:TRINITY_DN423_c0_g1_i3.p1 TRINITY_DN423_c0_g1~~TRINITY_DN423_c0_g1_i3.p1  ORF type:complete len:331 (-),score=74.97 TRINITY_DN423_c0_g1_i3:78-1070(-)